MMVVSMTACGSGKTAETTQAAADTTAAESADETKAEALQMALLIKLVSASWYSM